MSDVMHIHTRLGTIVITDKEDDEYPGVWIDLRRADFDTDMAIATVEVVSECNTLRSIVYGDGITDLPTEIIEHKNVEEWFKVV